MKLEYIIAKRTGGANPFKIWEAIQKADKTAIKWAIKRMPYSCFLESAYWLAVSSVAKSRVKMRCQVCNSADGIAVHHRTYDSHGEEHENMHDLVVLCDNCHGLFHGHMPARLPPRALSDEHDRKPKIKQRLVIPHADVSSEMPEGDTITLTRELVDRCRTNGTFTNASLRALGQTKPLLAGWPMRLIGKVLTRAQYHEALEGRFIYRSGPLSHDQAPVFEQSP